MMLQLADNGLEKGISFKKILKGAKKVGLAVPRNSFLSLIKLNVHNFATRLQRHIDMGHGAQIFAKWDKLGGKRSALEKAIRTGSKKKGLFDEGLSLEPATATFIASATAVLVAMKEFLKQSKDVVDQGKDVLGLVPKDAADPTDPKYADAFDKEAGGMFSTKTLLIVGGAAAVLYILTRKRK